MGHNQYSSPVPSQSMVEQDFNPFAKPINMDEDSPLEKIKSMDHTSAF